MNDCFNSSFEGLQYVAFELPVADRLHTFIGLNNSIKTFKAAILS